MDGASLERTLGRGSGRNGCVATLLRTGAHRVASQGRDVDAVVGGVPRGPGGLPHLWCPHPVLRVLQGVRQETRFDAPAPANHQLPQPALGSKTPVQAMKEW